MRALSLRQPWAWAVLHAGKRIENRRWPTKYRGPILIHAALGCSALEEKEALSFMIRQQLIQAADWPGLDRVYRGGIVGHAEIVDCINADDDRSRDKWFFGPYGFILKNVETLPFVRMKGMLGLFNVPNEANVCAERTGDVKKTDDR